MAHTVKNYKITGIKGISDKTNEIHHGKLYTGYVNKRNEVEEKLMKADLATANQVYSEYRGLKEGETFAANGMILHEVYFGPMGGNGDPKGTKIYDALIERYGSWEKFVEILTASGMAARGWAILAYDPSDSKLHIYTADAQNQGGVWGCTPLLAVDVYEHAYFIDYGSDRKTYISAYLNNVDWQVVDSKFKVAFAPTFAKAAVGKKASADQGGN